MPLAAPGRQNSHPHVKLASRRPCFVDADAVAHDLVLRVYGCDAGDVDGRAGPGHLLAGAQHTGPDHFGCREWGLGLDDGDLRDVFNDGEDSAEPAIQEEEPGFGLASDEGDAGRSADALESTSQERVEPLER